MTQRGYCDRCSSIDPLTDDDALPVRRWLETTDAASTVDRRDLDEAVVYVHRRCFSPELHLKE